MESIYFTFADDYGRERQVIEIIDPNTQKPTRERFMTVVNAKRATSNFRDDLEVGKTYLMKCLTPYGWRATRSFVYEGAQTNLEEKVFDEDYDEELYNDQALQDDGLNIYSVMIEEL